MAKHSPVERSKQDVMPFESIRLVLVKLIDSFAINCIISTFRTHLVKFERTKVRVKGSCWQKVNGTGHYNYSPAFLF